MEPIKVKTGMESYPGILVAFVCSGEKDDDGDPLVYGMVMQDGGFNIVPYYDIEFVRWID